MKGLVGAARAALEFFEHNAEHMSYGYPAGVDDPRDFTPDVESCREEEITAHAAAVAAWNEAGGKPEGWDAPDHGGWNESGTVHILRAPWGIGAYTYRDPELCALRDQLREALKAVGVSEQEEP